MNKKLKIEEIKTIKNSLDKESKEIYEKLEKFYDEYFKYLSKEGFKIKLKERIK